jgi:hypothetical protein
MIDCVTFVAKITKCQIIYKWKSPEHLHLIGLLASASQFFSQHGARSSIEAIIISSQSLHSSINYKSSRV